ncbi:Histidine Protein Methyltransferase 1-like [Manis pentadactyla]|nr:Histidine Protein Methyltransferase 1-like [Manis pentadactyla]
MEIDKWPERLCSSYSALSFFLLKRALVTMKATELQKARHQDRGCDAEEFRKHSLTWTYRSRKGGYTLKDYSSA